MSDGYSIYVGNAAGGSLTIPKPGFGVGPHLIIPSDGYVPTSAMFQQFEETVADFCAYNSVAPFDAYASFKGVKVDGIGGQNPSLGSLFFQCTGPAEFDDGLTVFGTETVTTLSATNIIGSATVGTGAPTTGHFYKDMQAIAYGYIGNAAGTITIYNEKNVSGTPAHNSTGKVTVTLQAGFASATLYTVVATAASSNISQIIAITTTGTAFQITTYTPAGTLADGDFTFVVYGAF